MSTKPSTTHHHLMPSLPMPTREPTNHKRITMHPNLGYSPSSPKPLHLRLCLLHFPTNEIPSTKLLPLVPPSNQPSSALSLIHASMIVEAHSSFSPHSTNKPCMCSNTTSSAMHTILPRLKPFSSQHQPPSWFLVLNSNHTFST